MELKTLDVHKSGVYGCENAISTKILLKDSKICSQKICLEHVLKMFAKKTNKQGVLIRAGGLEKFPKIT